MFLRQQPSNHGLLLTLTWSVAFLSSIHAHAQYEAMMVGMAKQGLAGTEAGVVVSGVDFGASLADYLCDKASSASTGCVTKIPWIETKGTPNLFLNGLGFMNSLRALQQAENVVAAVEGEGMPDDLDLDSKLGTGKIPSFEPYDFSLPQTDSMSTGLCKKNPKLFGCNKDDLKNLDLVQAEYENGNLEVPPGTPPDFFDQMKKAAAYVSTGDADMSAGLGASDEGSRNNGLSSQGSNKGSKGSSGVFEISGAGNTVGGTFGPQNREGLGAIFFHGNLRAYDENTSKELTLFQRATRRNLGIQTGSSATPRGNMLARMEFMRNQALKKLTLAGAPQKAQTQTVTAQSVTAGNPLRAPASLSSTPATMQ